MPQFRSALGVLVLETVGFAMSEPATPDKARFSLFARTRQALGGSPRKSIRTKFSYFVLGITASALLIAGVSMLSHDLAVYRQSWAASLTTEAAILARSTAPALAFSDRATAQRNLNALQAHDSVLSAVLYDEKGSLYAQYQRSDEPRAAGQVPVIDADLRISGEILELTHRIVQNGEFLGTIYLRARYDVMGRIKAYVTIFGLVMVASMIAALALATMLQRIITAPLYAIADAARQVIDERNYSERVRATTDDEVGVVVEAFNKMMDEVQSRTRELEESNRALKQEVYIRQEAELALSRANARLQTSMAAAEIGSWVRDVERNEVLVDRNLALLYGVHDENELNGDPKLLRQFVHPDDAAVVSAAEQTALRTGTLLTEFRIIRRDGSLRWFIARGKVQFDLSGRPSILAGLLIDTTAQRVAEQALRESEKLYRAIGESIDYGVWVCDAEGRNTYASDSFLRLTGMTQEQCSNVGWGEVLHPDDAQATVSDWRDCVRRGDNWYREHRILGVDGTYHPVLAQGVPIRNEDGKIWGWAGINLDISRLKRTEEALREADRRKDEFLATLAHELRNPLAPIRHATKILDTPAADDRQRQWSRDVIARQVQHMSLLLDDLLDVSRITRGRLELKKDNVSLETLVNSAVETARPLIESKRHALEVKLPPQPIILEVDPLRLSQALSNLLTNAAKYTDANGRILVTANVSGDDMAIAVKDSGIGISAHTIAKVFDMFSQVESAVDRSQGGLGIGLALVKGLIALHGGSVDVVSDGVGRGSTFTIHLPRSLIVERSSLARERGSDEVGTDHRCKVLIADDNQDGARSLGVVLEMSGYEVCVAYSGYEALDVGARERPDACILDIGMPELNGYETARRIRREAWGKNALLLAITGWGQQEDKEKARAAGFDFHFTKPVDLEQVERLLEVHAKQLDSQSVDARLIAKS